MEHGEFSNGSIKGKELSLDHPLANEMVDTLKLVPQGMANTYYTLHHLKTHRVPLGCLQYAL
ncbi:hypothetical protein CGH27_24900, partial [Vibrio parahaemolyticus]